MVDRCEGIFFFAKKYIICTYCMYVYIYIYVYNMYVYVCIDTLSQCTCVFICADAWVILKSM